MPVEIKMPEVGEGVHEGTVNRWLKKSGDYVKENEPVVEIMTDKVNMEIQSPASGVLQIMVPEGEFVEVFHPMGLIVEGDGAATGATTPPKDGPAAEAKKVDPTPTSAMPTVPVVDNGRHWFTPVVRSMAKENNISEAELDAITGTGPQGRVTKKDIETYLASGRTQLGPRTSGAPGPSGPAPVPQRPSSPPPSLEAKPAAPTVAGPDQTIVPLVGMRKMIADAMVRASQVPTVSTVTVCDVTSMVSFRERNKDAFLDQYGVKLTYTPFFIKAVAEALQEIPLLNSSLQPDNKILMNGGVHIGVSVALGAKGDEGLIVPVIRDCHKKNLIDIAKDLDKIAKKARANQLAVADVQGGTFTLTNPGTYGALFGTPMINAPQAAILGTYGINKEPVIIEDMIAIRSMMHLVLTYDHRIIDGLIAGQFLKAVRDKLQAFDFFK